MARQAMRLACLAGLVICTVAPVLPAQDTRGTIAAPRMAITGRVLAPDGQPVPNTFVTALRTGAFHANGEAKFWLEPTVELAVNYGLNTPRVHEASKLIEEHLDEIRSAWAKHFPG